MTSGHRGLLGLTTFLVAGQTLMIGLYCFLFAPMFFHGIGPEEEHINSTGATVRTVAAMLLGGLAVATNVWSCRGMARAVRDRISAARRLTAAGTVQAAVVAGAIRFDWLLAVVVSVAVLLSLLACRALDRRTFGT
ncbi:hypothetical protein FGW37_12165 [Streptomyces rectiverticillatus]|uniref:hypothetical protein n=1 Tax=Streptomyces rectiverticillatus TaxID=173860 RepID=UPI0015C2CB46|nr:hypothetical protein [Streptomyces rectiverticillatus]QLE72253.1 hypothetical protein FGW37_12165 [Streptomyces rectiverticillatus]